MKFEFIDAQKAHFPVDFMCEQLGVSRSGSYAWKERPESERHKADRAPAEVVTRIHRDSRGTYGSPRVHAEPVAPNLLERNFSPGQPNSTWATASSYVGTGQGWLYLAVVMDLFSRKVVGWSMSEHIDRHLVLNALDMALKGRQPPQGLLHHSTGAASAGFTSSCYGRPGRAAISP